MRALFMTAALAMAATPSLAGPSGTIAFPSLAPRGWEIHAVDAQSGQIRRLTGHPALDFNAAISPDGRRIAFVSERDGNMEIYSAGLDGGDLWRLTDDFGLDDHPAWSPDGRRIAFVSSRQPAKTPGHGWTAVYVMDADGANVRRLSPDEIPGGADYSPAWSPKGDLIAFASGSGGTGGTDLYVMDVDGGNRRLVTRNGGWPTFAADGRAICFHSRRDGAWGIWQVGLDGGEPQRVTPPGTTAYTPRFSPDGARLVAAIEKTGEQAGKRRAALIDPASGAATLLADVGADQWTPAISNDGRTVLFHATPPGLAAPNVERWGAPAGPGPTLLRVDGAFPSFSPDSRRIVLTGIDFASIDVMNADGSDRKVIRSGGRRSLFGLDWSRQGDRIAFSEGGVFQGPAGEVNVGVMRSDGSDPRMLTAISGNNAFPSFSPDGARIVFRSGREGSKNLFIMDADGANVRQLTRGPWTDTMGDWSPTGEWIAFASDRDGDFEVWAVRPDGTGLRKVIGGGGRNNHPRFSPDGEWLAFVSQRAGWSAEEISLPFQFQPYGDLFIVRLDGAGLARLTANGFEEGPPAWGR